MANRRELEKKRQQKKKKKKSACRRQEELNGCEGSYEEGSDEDLQGSY